MSKRTMLGACLWLLWLGFCMGLLVGGRVWGLTGGAAVSPGAARTESSFTPARSLVERGGVSDMELGLPDTRLTGGGDGGANPAAVSAAPASTTVTQALISPTATSVQQAATQASVVVAPVSTPTVIISAMTPTARATEAKSAAVQPSDLSGQLAGSLEAQVRASVERWFPASEIQTAMRVAYCESRYQPWAAEPGGRHFGVMQVDPSLWGAVPGDIDGQIQQAAVVWRAGSWAMWSCH